MQRHTNRFSRFEKSLKMPYLNFGRGLVVSIAHFNCLPSLLHCNKALCVHTLNDDDQEEAHQWTHLAIYVEATFGRRQGITYLITTPLISSRFLRVSKKSLGTPSLPALRTLQPQETHTPRYMWDEKQKHTQTHQMEHDDDFYRFFFFLCSSFAFDSWTQCVKRYVLLPDKQTP